MGLNLLVKGLFITSNSIAGDEPFSIYHAQMDVPSIIQQLTSGNNPPLYEIMLHFWIELFGISALAARLPSLIFSTLTVLFIYKLGRSFFYRRVAVTAALLFVFSDYHVLFAHEARAYALLGLLSVVSMYYYLKIVVHENFRFTFIISFVVASVILIYTHYFGLFVLWVQFVFLLFRKDLLYKYRRYFIVWGWLFFSALFLI